MKETVHLLELDREIHPSWHPIAHVYWERNGKEHGHVY